MVNKLKINIIGDIFSTTGYASHTRQLFNSLYKVADVKLSTQLFPGWEQHVNDAELDAIKKQGKENDIQLIITTPHNWKLFLGTGKNMVYCVWEGSKVPRSFIDEMLNPKIDLIFIPSEHTQNAILRTLAENWKEEYHIIVQKKLKIIHHGVDLFLFKSLEKKHDKFTFICNKGWRGTSWDRGGVQYLLKAFNEEFTKEDNVKLLIKLNPAYINPQQLQQGMAMLNLEKDKAEIQICMDNIPYEKLSNLYNLGDVYVCPTRCESFDLGSAEAMACGLSVISNGYGGQIEHMNKDCSLFCDYKLEEVKTDLMYEGIEWSNVNIQDLRKKMRWCYENQYMIKEMGNNAKEFISSWTWDNSTKSIIEAINDIYTLK